MFFQAQKIIQESPINLMVKTHGFPVDFPLNQSIEKMELYATHSWRTSSPIVPNPWDQCVPPGDGFFVTLFGEKKQVILLLLYIVMIIVITIIIYSLLLHIVTMMISIIVKYCYYDD